MTATILPIGVQELVLILLIVLVLFGATRLPELGRGVGEAIRNFRKGVKEDGGEAAPAAESGGGGAPAKDSSAAAEGRSGTGS